MWSTTCRQAAQTLHAPPTFPGPASAHLLHRLEGDLLLLQLRHAEPRLVQLLAQRRLRLGGHLALTLSGGCRRLPLTLGSGRSLLQLLLGGGRSLLQLGAALLQLQATRLQLLAAAGVGG